MEIDMHDIEAHIGRTGDTKHRVQVGTIIVHQSATVMHQLCDGRYLTLEESESVRVGHHHGGNVIAKERLQILNVDKSVGCALHLHNLQSADSGRGRVSAMGRVRHNDFGTIDIATAGVVGTYSHETRQLAMCSGEWVESELSHASEGTESLLETTVDSQRALDSLGRL